MSGRFEIGGETFDAWEIEELEDVTSRAQIGRLAVRS
jgi:hypothetical protein